MKRAASLPTLWLSADTLPHLLLSQTQQQQAPPTAASSGQRPPPHIPLPLPSRVLTPSLTCCCPPGRSSSKLAPPQLALGSAPTPAAAAERIDRALLALKGPRLAALNREWAEENAGGCVLPRRHPDAERKTGALLRAVWEGRKMRYGLHSADGGVGGSVVNAAPGGPNGQHT